MTSSPRELVSTIVLSFVVTLSSASGMCQAPPESPTSYGRLFVIPFPNVNVTVSAAFQYQVYVTNPGNVTVGVTMASCDGASRQNASVEAKRSAVFPFNSSYMMIGEGKFGKCVTLTAEMDIGVHVLATEKMDGFTAHPVNSWGSDYRVVTHCGFDGELCQVVIVVNQTSQVKIMLLGQGANTISHVTSPPVTNASTFDVTIAPGEVYQLQRKFDMTGAQITSNVPVGVLSGAANAKVGRGTTPGAFMEHMPPVRSAGTDYIVPLAPGQPSGTEYVRVMALEDSTTVFIWSGEKRFVMNEFQHVTRPLTKPLMLIESDRPIMVVKFGRTPYPTMSVVVPTTLFLTGATFVVTQLTNANGLDQYVIVVKSNASTVCEDQLNAATMNSIPGTDLIAMWYHVTTSFYLTCPSSAMAYSYVSSNDFSAQYPIAFSHGSINLPCILTQGSPGDAIDNDCDGRVDEDDCSTSTPPGNVDCAPVISGDRDVYGKSFTFLVPPNGNGSEVMLLFASCSPEKDVLITVTTPLDLSLVNMTAKILAGENHTSLNVSNTGVIADGSRIFRDRTVHVAADSEISVTLVVLTSVPTASGLSVLVIPDDVLGQEYFIAAFTKNNASCTIQITAFHVNTTTVKIRLRLPDTTSSLEFEGQQYHAGQLICVDLEQYQSLQIQEPIDLSGTHITSNKPVSVWSGGILAYTHSPTNRDSFSEHLPPTVSWGMKYIVRLSDMSLVRNKNVAPCPTKGCEDFLKIVSSESNTAVNIVFNSSLNNNCTLGNPGDFLQILVLTELLVITANKPVLVVQILASYTNSETSASYVAPVEQYLTGDRIVFPNLTDVIVRQLLVTYSLDNSSGRVLLAGDANITMVDSTLHGAGSAVYNSSKNFQLLSGRPKFPFGGHVFFSGSRRTMLQPIAFAMKKTNQACEISTSQPGDGRDNDCDGTVDEEDCGPNNDPQGTDDDNDGMANEDCKVPPLTSSLPTDSPTASYSTPDLDYTASDGLTSATDQATEDLSTSFFQDLTTGYSQDSTTSYSHDLTTSYSQDSTTGYSQDLYTSYSQDLTTSYSQDVTTSYSQDLTTSYSQDLTTSYSQDLTTSSSQDLTTSYSHDSTTEFTETQALASVTDHTSELAPSPPQPSATFVSPGVTSSVWPEMTSSHGTDSLISTDLESVTDTLDSGFPSSISHPETESQSTEQLGASSATPSSLSPSLMGLTPSSTESTSTTTISPSSSTLMSATAPTTAAAMALSASASSTTTTKTATAVLSSHPCGCLCPSNVLTSRLQSSQIDSLRSSIQKNLEVDKSELSATTRKLISVNDQRPSAQTIGFFGVTLVVVAFSGIVLLDSGILIRNIMKLIQKCKRKT